MLSLPGRARIFVAREPVDFRKAFDGLCAVIRDGLGDDPFGADVFVFFNRRRDRIKLLTWDGNGFWLFYKRLERGTFEQLSIAPDVTRCEVDRARLSMLLEGIVVRNVRFRKHFTRRVRLQSRADEGRIRTAASG